MSSLYPKKVNGKTYWYLRTMARVDGKPKMISERYLGSAADVAAAFDAGDTAVMPQRTRHLAFGDVAAVWSMCQRLGVIGVIDEITGGRVAGAPCSIGTYLAVAVCNRITAPCSKARIADWWAQTAADRFTKIRATDLDHRRFWDAMHAVTPGQLEQISQTITAAMITDFGLDTTALALDMTNFATYIASVNTKAPIAQRGKAKQKRTDLRLVGLGLVITRDGGIPLTWHAYPGNKPDVTQFPAMIDTLTARYRALGTDTGTITVVFDAGQNSAANFAHLTGAGLHYVGSTPPSDHPESPGPHAGPGTASSPPAAARHRVPSTTPPRPSSTGPGRRSGSSPRCNRLPATATAPCACSPSAPCADANSAAGESNPGSATHGAYVRRPRARSLEGRPAPGLSEHG
ncbi:IS1634 family transposase [Rhodococcus sp. WS4]|nr:IS1634 family transposase [Rhodococcus sp. WS4]